LVLVELFSCGRLGDGRFGYKRGTILGCLLGSIAWITEKSKGCETREEIAWFVRA